MYLLASELHYTFKYCIYLNVRCNAEMFIQLILNIFFPRTISKI